MSQEELFKAETTWFHVFKDMIDSGDLALMDGSVVKCYLVIKAHTNFSTGRAWPGIELIAEKTGLSESQVKRCLKKLEELKYITKEKSGRNNKYTLREKVNILDAEGKRQAVATWDYIPYGVREAVADLRNVMVDSSLAGAKLVHIEHLHLNLNVQNGSNNQQININAADLAKLPKHLREYFERMATTKQAEQKN